VVEYALDVIQEAQDYPDGLQRLAEYQVSILLYHCCIINAAVTRNRIGEFSIPKSSLGNGDFTHTSWLFMSDVQRTAYTIEENREQFTFQASPSPLAMAGGVTDKDHPVFANSFVPELVILMHRELLSFLRTPAVFFVRISLAVRVKCSLPSSQVSTMFTFRVISG
jgi:hypothetical protein